MHIDTNVNIVGPKWAKVCKTLVLARATMTAHSRTCWGSVVSWLLSLLISPRRTLERDGLARERKLRAAFARGRKKRRDRTGA